MQPKESGQKILRKNRVNKKFIYLISPNKIKDNLFYYSLEQVLKTRKISFFQLRLKKESIRKQIGMAVPPEGIKIIFQAILNSFAGNKYDHIPSNIKV